MNRNTNQISIAEYPVPETSSIELQVIADIVSTQSLMQYAGGISEEHFATEDCRNAWRILKQMSESNKTIDLSTFCPNVPQDFANEVMHRSTDTAYTEFRFAGHIDSLKKSSAMRKAYFAAVDILKACNGKDFSADDVLAIPERLAQNLNTIFTADDETQSVAQVIDELKVSLADEQEFPSAKSSHVPTKISYIDEATYGGFGAGNLVILAARPSVGKTAIMLNIARNATCNGYAATIFSLEMTKLELAKRIMLASNEIEPVQMIRGMDWERFDNVAGRYAGTQLFINDSARNIEQICSKIITNHKRGMADIVFVDYLGLINASAPANTPLYQRIGQITCRLKQVAKACSIPVVLLCQLNRQSAEDNRPPQLYDLRDSGNIEQDADIVLMLERAKDADGDKLNMWVRKNRNGKAGMCIQLQPNRTYTDFSETGAFAG